MVTALSCLSSSGGRPSLEHVDELDHLRAGVGTRDGLIVAEPDPDAMAHAAVRSAAENIDEAGIVKLGAALSWRS